MDTIVEKDECLVDAVEYFHVFLTVFPTVRSLSLPHRYEVGTVSLARPELMVNFYYFHLASLKRDIFKTFYGCVLCDIIVCAAVNIGRTFRGTQLLGHQAFQDTQIDNFWRNAHFGTCSVYLITTFRLQWRCSLFFLVNVTLHQWTWVTVLPGYIGPPEPEKKSYFNHLQESRPTLLPYVGVRDTQEIVD